MARADNRRTGWGLWWGCCELTFLQEMKFAQTCTILSFFWFLLLGCNNNKPKNHSTSPKSALLEGIGTLESPHGTWSVEMKKTPSKLVVSRQRKGVKVSESPNYWDTSEGAFIYIDEEDRVWAYDGIKSSFIIESTNDGTISWDFNTWKNNFPVAVTERIKR